MPAKKNHNNNEYGFGEKQKMNIGGLPVSAVLRIKKVGYNRWWEEQCAKCSDADLNKVEKELTDKYNFEVRAIKTEQEKRKCKMSN